MKKSIFKTIILISAIALAAAPVFSKTKKKTQETQPAETESSQSYWDGAPAVLKKTPFEFEGGSGTLKDPYLIKTAEQLNSVRFGLSKHYKLIADIDLSKWGNWIPIGGTPAYAGAFIRKHPEKADAGCGVFTGSFNGNDHVISGMTIIDHNDDIPMGDREYEFNQTRAYALFGAIIPEKNSFIRNLGVVNYTIDISYTKMKYYCDLRVAAISHFASGLIVENCYTSGGKIKVHTGRASDNPNQTNVVVGGMFTEFEDSRVTNCYNTSPIIITTSDTDYMNYNNANETAMFGKFRSVHASGIATEMMYTHITGCMNAGEVTVPYANWGASSLAGGITARVTCLGKQGIYNLPPEAASTITSCYNIGKITGTYASGILGSTRTDCYISDCYNVGELVLDEDNPQKDYIATFKDDIVNSGTLLECGKKYVHDNGIKVVHGSRWIDSPRLGRKILKAIPEDKLGIKPSEPEAPVQIAGFSDVMSNDDFARAVPWAVENGIAKPSSKTTFSPNEPCTRGQVVEYIYRWQGSPKASGKNPFKDVKSSDTFYNAVRWASKNGFIDGKTFNGNAPCTRGDALEILYKCSGSMSMIAIDKFTDVPRSSKYQQPVSWAYYGAIAKPTTKTTFEPESVCTKGQIVTFIYQVEHTGLKDWMDTTQKNSNPKSSKKNAKSDSNQQNENSASSQVDAIIESTLKEMGLEDLLNGNQF